MDTRYIAVIAHDAKKEDIVAFVQRHEAYLRGQRACRHADDGNADRGANRPCGKNHAVGADGRRFADWRVNRDR